MAHALLLSLREYKQLRRVAEWVVRRAVAGPGGVERGGTAVQAAEVAAWAAVVLAGGKAEVAAVDRVAVVVDKVVVEVESPAEVGADKVVEVAVVVPAAAVRVV